MPFLVWCDFVCPRNCLRNCEHLLKWFHTRSIPLLCASLDHAANLGNLGDANAPRMLQEFDVSDAPCTAPYAGSPNSPSPRWDWIMRSLLSFFSEEAGDAGLL